MVIIGNNHKIKTPQPGELSRPIVLVKKSDAPDTTGTNVEFDKKLQVYRKAWAKVTIGRGFTRSANRDFEEDITHNFIIRKNPKELIEKYVDAILYDNYMYKIVEVRQLGDDDRSQFIVLACMKQGEIQDYDHTVEEIATPEKNEDDDTQFPNFI